MATMDNGEVIISGYLSKSPPESKLRNLRSWTKRFFVLYANKLLYYYKTDKEKKPIKDPIKLTHCKCVESNLKHERFKFVFSVTTDHRTYYLVADSQQDMENWVEKLCIVCGFKRTDPQHSPDLNAARKPNAYSASQTHPQPIANKQRIKSPVGTPSSFSSSGSSLTSPTGPCPLSIPKHIMDERINKQRSMSDPPEHSAETPPVYHGNFRRQSEQVGSSTFPVDVQGQNKARLSGNLSETSPSPRPSSGDAYDNLPSPKKVSHQLSSPGVEKRLEFGTLQDNYDDVPIPRALDRASSPSSPRLKLGHNLSPDDYDAVPTPRPVSQDDYDIVPPPQPMSSCSQDGQGLYDVPPVGRALEQENYDVVPLPRRMSNSQDGQSLYDVPPVGNSPEQENYDIVPSVHQSVAPKPSHFQPDSSQQNYDVVPMRQSIYDVPPVRRALEQENYDIVPPHRPVAPKPINHIQSGNSHQVYNGLGAYDVLPTGRSSEQENYDTVPPVLRPLAPKPNHLQQGASQETYDIVPMRQTLPEFYNGKSVYDNLPTERASTQENYDIVPPIDRRVSSKPSHIQPYTSQDNYDAVPIPRPSDENYDFVPKPRAIPGNLTSNQGSVLANSNELDNRFSDIHSATPNQQSSNPHEWVAGPPRPAPYQHGKDGYDPLPNTNRPVSADSGLNASFSSICSLKSEGDYGNEDRYDAPLPALPHARDSGSLSDDDMPDDNINPNDVYDTPPNWESRNSIYDVPPKQDSVYDVLPSYPNEIYDTPSTNSDEIYDVPPNRDQGLEPAGIPVVDRSTKRPPMVNRAVKPKAPTEGHTYCNMPPKVDRESKYKRSTMPQPDHSYTNMGAPPLRPQNLPLVKVLTGNPFVGSLPNQASRWSTGPANDADYCAMQPPTRSEITRCYSLTEDKRRSRSPDDDQCYEDMSAMQTRRYSSGKSTSSSSSSLADNDDTYVPMVPSHHGSSPSQVEQRQRRDLLYAEVEIQGLGPQNLKAPIATPPRRENTNYTFINEESTRALLQTSHTRQGNR